jgi:hypothetical protein
MLLVVGGLVGWRLWRVDTISAAMGGHWNGETHVYDADVLVTLRLTTGSRSGRQVTNPSD